MVEMAPIFALPHRPFGRFGTLVPLVLAVLFFLAAAYSVSDYLLDDAFITYRYAQNIAGGHGVVWNIEGPATEGFSSPLMVALMVPVEFFHLPTLSVNQVAGVVILGFLMPGLLWFGIRSMRWKEGSRLEQVALLLPAVWLMLGPTAVHAINGMETYLAIALLTALVVAVGTEIRRLESGKPSAWTRVAWISLLAILVTLCRSEGIAQASICLAVMFLYRSSRGTAVRCLSVLGAFCGVYAVWKLAVFGYLLPNPFYIKVGGAGNAGLEEVIGFLSSLAFAAVLPLIAWWLRPPIRVGDWDPVELTGAVMVAFFGVFFMFVQPVASPAYRMLWPYAPIILLLAAAALARIDAAIESAAASSPTTIRQQLVSAAVWLLMVTAIGFGLVRATPEQLVRNILSHPFDLEKLEFITNYQSHWKIGTVLGSLALDYETTVSATEAGIIPYFAATRSLDLVGLNDNVIARGSEDEISQYLAENPIDIDYDLSTSGALDDFAFVVSDDPRAQRSIHDMARRRFAKRVRDFYYAGNYSWGVDERRRDLVIWVRKSHPRAREIVNALIQSSDRVNAGFVRWGPYPEDILRSCLTEELHLRLTAK